MKLNSISLKYLPSIFIISIVISTLILTIFTSPTFSLSVSRSTPTHRSTTTRSQSSHQILRDISTLPFPNNTTDINDYLSKLIGQSNTTPNDFYSPLVSPKHIQSSNFFLQGLQLEPLKQNYQFQASSFDISNVTITHLKIESIKYHYNDTGNTHIDFIISGIDVDANGQFQYSLFPSIIEDSGLFNSTIRQAKIEITLTALNDTNIEYYRNQITTTNDSNNKDGLIQRHIISIMGEKFLLSVETTIPQLTIKVLNTLLAPIYNIILRRFEKDISNLIGKLISQNIYQYLIQFLPQLYHKYLQFRRTLAAGLFNSIFNYRSPIPNINTNHNPYSRHDRYNIRNNNGNNNARNTSDSATINNSNIIHNNLINSLNDIVRRHNVDMNNNNSTNNDHNDNNLRNMNNLSPTPLPSSTPTRHSNTPSTPPTHPITQPTYPTIQPNPVHSPPINHEMINPATINTLPPFESRYHSREHNHNYPHRRHRYRRNRYNNDDDNNDHEPSSDNSPNHHRRRHYRSRNRSNYDSTSTPNHLHNPSHRNRDYYRSFT